MTDAAHESMTGNERWREYARFLTQELLVAAHEHGFDPKFDLLLDQTMALGQRTSYRAGFEIQAERVKELEGDVGVLQVEKAGAQERTQIACRHFDSANTRAHALADAIKKHRAQKADDRCIFDDDELYAALGDGIKCDRDVGSQDAMLESCKRFIKCRTLEGKWPTYVEMEAERDAALGDLEASRLNIAAVERASEERAVIIGELRAELERSKREVERKQTEIGVLRATLESVRGFLREADDEGTFDVMYVEREWDRRKGWHVQLAEEIEETLAPCEYAPFEPTDVKPPAP